MGNPHTRRIATVCAAEAIRVAQALGHPLEPILHMPPSLWLAAANGEPGAVAELEDGWTRWMARSRAPHYGSIGQDLATGRRIEKQVAHFNRCARWVRGRNYRGVHVAPLGFYLPCSIADARARNKRQA